jgi:hypothetical protein
LLTDLPIHTGRTGRAKILVLTGNLPFVIFALKWAVTDAAAFGLKNFSHDNNDDNQNNLSSNFIQLTHLNE